MKEGLKMANKNGMGPGNEGPSTGRGLGACESTNVGIRKLGHGIIGGQFGGKGSRKRMNGNRNKRNNRENNGRGRCFQNQAFVQTAYAENKETLENYKLELQQALDAVENKLAAF